MGRKPSKPNAIPRLRLRVRGKKTFYYYDHGGKPRRETPLGSDYGLAIKRWAEIEQANELPAPAVLTFRWVAEEYLRVIVPTKAMRTQADNRREVQKLLEFYDDPPGAPLEDLEPVHVRKYLTWRKATTRANREKALLSAIWNFARDKGYTALPNPCAGIRGHVEKGRDTYIEDDQFEAIWEKADVCLRDAMDLAYLTGQRPSDVLRLSEMDLRDGALHVRQSKTGARIRIDVSGDLAALIERIRARKKAYRVYSTRLVVNEQGRTLGANAISRRWATACKAAGFTGLQFRDLRAKAGTDKADTSGDIRQAQKQLGHGSVVMTEAYVRNRRGAKVSPTK